MEEVHRAAMEMAWILPDRVRSEIRLRVGDARRLEIEDGTVDVLCEADNTVVQGVPLEFIQPVDITSGVAAQLEADGGEHHIEGVDTFFNLFVQSLMGGATFAKLTPAQQAVASEKVQGLRPHFEAELGEFKDKRGHGATVTSEDIKTMLPRVMARAKAA